MFTANAIKFTPEAGSIDVKMTWNVASVSESTTVNLQDGLVECLYQTGWIEIEVTDTGHGMTPDQLATVFESGVQFNANKNVIVIELYGQILSALKTRIRGFLPCCFRICHFLTDRIQPCIIVHNFWIMNRKFEITL